MFDDDGKPVPVGLIEEYGIDNRTLGLPPDWNFNSYFEGNLVNAILLANDGWTAIYFDYYRCLGGLITTLYFIPLVIFGQHILMSLFLTLILNEFNEYSLD